MTSTAKAQLEAAGIDVSGALSRFMGNESLLERFLKKFLTDENYSHLQEALSGNDLNGAITAAHTLKGLCGNLSMTDLFELFSRQVALFRNDDLAGGTAMMEEISQAYEKTVEAITAALL